jgi:hypothetical protein
MNIIISKKGYVGFLCDAFYGTEYQKDWFRFWDKVNTLNKLSVIGYYNVPPSDFEIGLVRLMLVEDFKQYLKGRNKWKQ